MDDSYGFPYCKRTGIKEFQRKMPTMMKIKVILYFSWISPMNFGELPNLQGAQSLLTTCAGTHQVSTNTDIQ